MMHIRFKYKVALSSIVIMMVMVTLTGFSYAYFTTQVSGEGNDIVIETGDVLMNFTEGGKDINLTNELIDGLNKILKAQKEEDLRNAKIVKEERIKKLKKELKVLEN